MHIFSDPHAALKQARDFIDAERYDDALVTLNNFCAQKRSHRKVCSRIHEADALIKQVGRALQREHAKAAPVVAPPSPPAVAKPSTPPQTSPARQPSSNYASRTPSPVSYRAPMRQPAPRMAMPGAMDVFSPRNNAMNVMNPMSYNGYGMNPQFSAFNRPTFLTGPDFFGDPFTTTTVMPNLMGGSTITSCDPFDRQTVITDGMGDIEIINQDMFGNTQVVEENRFGQVTEIDQNMFGDRTVSTGNDMPFFDRY